MIKSPRAESPIATASTAAALPAAASPASAEQTVQSSQTVTSSLAALRRRLNDFKPKIIDVTLHRDLVHGWMLPTLLQIDACLWGRWDYWLNCTEGNGTLPDAPIPPLNLLTCPHPATRKMLEASLNCIPQHGSWQTWGGWQFFDFLLDWLLFGLGHNGQTTAPTEPGGCAGASSRLYQVFCLDAMLLWPHDYFGDLLQESRYGKGQGFYPTPHTLCEAMARMLMDEGRDCRRETVCDPCVGTGRMLLHASNHSLRLYACDIDLTLCKATLVNGFLYMPWLVRPIPWLDRELAALEWASPDAQAVHQVAASLSDQMAASAPPHLQDRLHDTEHDAAEQSTVAPILKRRRKMVNPSQGSLF